MKIEKTGLWLDHGICLERRLIFLENFEKTDSAEDNEVAHSMSARLFKGMEILENSSNNPITIIVNTPGGFEYPGFAIYDRIYYSPVKVIIRGTGHIMSMGSIILQAADLRELTPNTWVMIHNGWNSVIDVNAQTICNWGKHYKDMNNKMYDIYLEKMAEKNSKMTLSKVRGLCQNDTIFTAEEAIEAGLADKLYVGEGN